MAEGFEVVREAFVRNFEVLGDRGAAVAVYRDGRRVVDLWAGPKDVEGGGGEAWAPGTAQVVRSATKGVAAVVPLLLHQRGLLDLDAPVAEYWPEFKAGGKERALVRDLLAHRAGVAGAGRAADSRRGGGRGQRSARGRRAARLLGAGVRARLPRADLQLAAVGAGAAGDRGLAGQVAGPRRSRGRAGWSSGSACPERRRPGWDGWGRWKRRSCRGRSVPGPAETFRRRTPTRPR